MADLAPEVPLEAHALAAIYPHRSAKHRDGTVVAQMQHRIDLINFWDIKAGNTVLEIGCGQGDCTVAIAAAIGDSGHVTALDPASPDYGEYRCDFTLSAFIEYCLCLKVARIHSDKLRLIFPLRPWDPA